MSDVRQKVPDSKQWPQLFPASQVLLLSCAQLKPGCCPVLPHPPQTLAHVGNTPPPALLETPLPSLEDPALTEVKETV